MDEPLSDGALKVQNALNALGVELKVVELPASTRTAEEAAAAIGCQVGQIAKSLIFKSVQRGEPLLVIASGTNRVNEQAVGLHVGEAVELADADFVRRQTGFSIGGVPPVGHARSLPVYIDRDLIENSEIWAAAGTPHAVFRLSPDDLVQITRGTVITVS